MLRKTLLTLSASVLLGAAVAAPNAALAQFGPPPGPPPMLAGPPLCLGAGGPPPGLGVGSPPLNVSFGRTCRWPSDPWPLGRTFAGHRRWPRLDGAGG